MLVTKPFSIGQINHHNHKINGWSIGIILIWQRQLYTRSSAVTAQKTRFLPVGEKST